MKHTVLSIVSCYILTHNLSLIDSSYACSQSSIPVHWRTGIANTKPNTAGGLSPLPRPFLTACHAG